MLKRIINSMIKPKFSRLSTLVLLIVNQIASAENLGQIAGNLQSTVSGAVAGVRTICTIVGAGLVLASLIKFKEHRSNPVEHPFGRVLLLFLFGLALIALAFVPMSK
jgi:hypothetical protein